MTPGAGAGRRAPCIWQDLLRRPAAISRDVVGHHSLRGLSCGLLLAGEEVGLWWVRELPGSHRPRPGKAQGGPCDQPLRPHAAI